MKIMQVLTKNELEERKKGGGREKIELLGDNPNLHYELLTICVCVTDVHIIGVPAATLFSQIP